MLRNVDDQALWRVRMLPKDLGVALVVLAALGLALILRVQVEGSVRQFQAPDAPLRLVYPATWRSASSLQDVLLKVENPLSKSTFKTTLTVEARELDPAATPPLQELVDRRIEQRSSLLGYHFLASNPARVDETDAVQIEYAYVVQPIDEPRRASLPVVVHAREYVVSAGERSYYVTLAAPADEFAGARAALDQIIGSARLRP
ncbi:MAG: hypothetical protein ACJ8CR_31990 [Roseiflexaceae bacterium]